MKRFSLLFFVAAIISFCSCYRIAFKSLGVLDVNPSLKKMQSNDKEIVFIPMHHLGKKEFYDAVKVNIDSLRKAGYFLYYEGIKVGKTNTPASDTLAMKTRKVLGIDIKSLLANGGYADSASGFFGHKVKSIAKFKLVNQPQGYILLDTTIDKKADVYLSDLMVAMENELGPIPLTQCDFESKSGVKYTCPRFKHKAGMKFMLKYRDAFVANEIMADKHDKIAIVYGSKHFSGMLKFLHQHDASWKKIK